MSSFAVEVPGTGEEIQSDEAARRGIVTHEEVEELIKMKEDKSKMSMYGSVASLNSYHQSKEGSPVRAVSPTNSINNSRMTHQTDRDTTKCLDRAIFLSSKARKNVRESTLRAQIPDTLDVKMP